VIGWLGLFFGWCARERLRVDGPWSQPSISLVLLFAGMILAPGAVYFYLVHADWSWLYLIDSRKVPRFAVLTIVVLHAGALVSGFYAAGRLVRAGRELWLRLALPGYAVVLLMIMLLARGRIGRYGTYEQFKGGSALPLFDVKLGYVLIAAVIGAGAAAAVVAWELYRDGRRAASR
jgi:hypothetical protein